MYGILSVIMLLMGAASLESGGVNPLGVYCCFLSVCCFAMPAWKAILMKKYPGPSYINIDHKGGITK